MFLGLRGEVQHLQEVVLQCAWQHLRLAHNQPPRQSKAQGKQHILFLTDNLSRENSLRESVHHQWLVSCLVSTKIVNLLLGKVAESKPVKQNSSHTVILPLAKFSLIQDVVFICQSVDNMVNT